MVFSGAETIPLVNSPLLGKSPPAQTVTYKETKISSNIKLKCTLYIKMCPYKFRWNGRGGGVGILNTFYMYYMYIVD